MTDGTTGIQVAPIASEEDMRVLSTMFQRVAASIVQASLYPAQVSELQAELAKLRSEVENLHAHNSALDGTIIDLRDERDRLRNDNSMQADLIERLGKSAEQNLRIITEQEAKLNNLSNDLDTAKRDRDEYGLRAMQLEDEVKGWKLKAEAARAKLNDLLASFKEPEPEPVPEPAKPVEVAQSWPYDQPAATATTESPAAPATEPPKPEPEPEPNPEPWRNW